MDTPLPRSQFPVTERRTYLNHGGMAPLPIVAADAARAVYDDFVQDGAVHIVEWEARQEDVRASAARLLGVPAADVAFVKNTTEGLAFVANGLEWRPGDRVLVPDFEFHSTVFPWLSLRDRGVDVELIQPIGAGRTLPLECFADALAAAPTRLVCTSWVQFGRGWRTDLAGLAALCHEHGALLCADVIQGLGVLPAELAAWGVDFAATDAYKWMLGPLGSGVLYVAERCRELLRPLEPGWASVAHREEWDNLDLVYDESARRFEGGTLGLAAIMAMGASLDLLLDTGIERIWTHVDALVDQAAAGLTDVGATVLSDRSAAGRSANLTFTVDGVDPAELWARLDEQGIVCSPRAGGIRVGPHGYNNSDDIDHLVGAVAALARR